MMAASMCILQPQDHRGEARVLLEVAADSALAKSGRKEHLGHRRHRSLYHNKVAKVETLKGRTVQALALQQSCCSMLSRKIASCFQYRQ